MKNSNTEFCFAYGFYQYSVYFIMIFYCVGQGRRCLEGFQSSGLINYIVLSSYLLGSRYIIHFYPGVIKSKFSG